MNKARMFFNKLKRCSSDLLFLRRIRLHLEAKSWKKQLAARLKASKHAAGVFTVKPLPQLLPFREIVEEVRLIAAGVENVCIKAQKLPDEAWFTDKNTIETGLTYLSERMVEINASFEKMQALISVVKEELPPKKEPFFINYIIGSITNLVDQPNLLFRAEGDLTVINGDYWDVWRLKAAQAGTAWDDMPTDMRRQYLFVKQVVTETLRGKFVYYPSKEGKAVVEILFPRDIHHYYCEKTIV